MQKSPAETSSTVEAFEMEDRAPRDPEQIASEKFEEALHLLENYVAKGSSIKRFFNGDWKLTHVDEVKRIVGNPSIKTLSSLLQRLDGITLRTANDPFTTILNTITSLPDMRSRERSPNPPTAPAMAAFLNHFDYLDETGHRKKTLASLLGRNSQLTQRIEAAAGTLQNTLHTVLSATTVANTEQFRAFLEALNTALTTVWDARRELGETSYLATPTGDIVQPLHPTAYSASFFQPTEAPAEYKTPYSCGKFEENLINGITAAALFFPQNSGQYIQLQTIIGKIKGYSATPFIVESPKQTLRF